jgi:hypothetical protein
MGINSNATVNVAGNQNNITITEISGNGTNFINATPSYFANLSGGTIQEILFNCLPDYGQTPGIYESIYNVNSTDDISGDNITVSCEVLGSFVQWNESMIDLVSYSGSSSNYSS